jgi:hypothetical protein
MKLTQKAADPMGNKIDTSREKINSVRSKDLNYWDK